MKKKRIRRKKKNLKRHKQSEHNNQQTIRKAETGEEEKEGDKEQEKIKEGRRRRRGKKKKQRISHLELKISAMGCETQYEKENQEEPGETKGDTEKLQCVGGGRQVFSVIFVCAHQPKFAHPQNKEKTITCDILQKPGA